MMFDTEEWNARRSENHDDIVFGKGRNPEPPRLEGLLENLQLRSQLTPICDSPIEVDLGAALIKAVAGRFSIAPQYRIGRFIYDFGVSFSDGLIALIECDGAQFHSTAAQLANDARKDAVANGLGVIMFRFTGSEIYRNPSALAHSVVQRLDSLVRS